MFSGKVTMHAQQRRMRFCVFDIQNILKMFKTFTLARNEFFVNVEKMAFLRAHSETKSLTNATNNVKIAIIKIPYKNA